MRVNGVLTRTLYSALSITCFTGALSAATVAGWISPANGSSFAVGTVVSPTGQASGVGSIGDTLEIALILDSSGSMGTVETAGSITQTRRLWQQDAAKALVNSLNTSTSSVGVVEFDSSASVVNPLTPLSSGLAGVISGIESVDASGGTNIPSGMVLGTPMLTGGTAGASKHMVVSSDGATSGDPAAAAAAAAAAGIVVHSIALPGADLATMQAIATAGGGTFVDASDPTSLTALINLLAGIGGNLVALDHIDVRLPDGTLVTNVAFDGFGNFTAPSYALQAGNNIFTVFAYGDDGSSAQADLNLVGVTSTVPEPATISLLAGGLLAMALAARKRRAVR
jgi:Ca-activated chloride channel homolog